MHITHVESVVTNALRLAAEKYTEAADEARKGAAQPERDRTPQPGADGSLTIDITPTPAGYARMIPVFERQAKDARELADMIEGDGLASVLRKANV